MCKIRHGLGRHLNPSNFSLIKDMTTGIEIKEVGIMTRQVTFVQERYEDY